MSVEDGYTPTIGYQRLVTGGERKIPHSCWRIAEGGPVRLSIIQGESGLVPADPGELGAVVRCHCGRYWEGVEVAEQVWWAPITGGRARRLERKARRRS